MNNKFLKILTVISAFAIAGLLSLAPATNAQAATSDQGYVYSITIYDENIDIDYTNSTDYSTSIDMQYISSLTNGFTSDDLLCNVWFSAANYTTTDFTLTVGFPYTVTTIDFFRFYDESGAGSGVGILDSYSCSGNHIAFSGTTDSVGGFDIIFTVSFETKEPESHSDQFFREINNVTNDIIKAASGMNRDGSENPQKVVFYNCNGAINYKIIRALAQTQGVTLFYTFEYEGYIFTSAITSENAAKIYSEGLDWYGPCYIASNCPTALVGVAQ